MKSFITLLAALLAMAVSLLTVAGLFGVRGAVSARLDETAGLLRALAGESVETVIRVRTTMPLEVEIRITRPTTIDLQLDVSDRLPVKLDVKVHEEIKVPIALDIDEAIDIDSAVLVAAGSKVRAKTDIDIDQPVRWRIANPFRPLLNIKGRVAVDHDVEIEFPEALKVKGRIPVRFPLREEVLVPVDLEIPVDQHLDLELAIRQQAQVGFPEPLLITADIPVDLEIPVRVPLGETAIGPALEKLAAQMAGLLSAPGAR
jgi:hypothetical protein